MKKLVIANMKMNFDFENIKEYIKKVKNMENVVICPTSIYIPFFKDFKVGMQNVFFENEGAFTGEVSPQQAKSLNVAYVIIGHSERKKYFQETNEIINKKVQKSLENDLKVILCIEEKTKKSNEKKVDKQIRECLKNIDDMKDLIIAYEPVWAIGTGVTPTVEQIEKTAIHIKDYFQRHYKRDINVLYGGSVGEKNIESLNNIQSIDGFLVGTAAKSINELNKIIEVTNR